MQYVDTVRRLIADTAATPEFSDADVEAALTETRVRHFDIDLEAIGTRDNSNFTVYRTFQAPERYWGLGYILRDNAGTVLGFYAADINDDEGDYSGIQYADFDRLSGTALIKNTVVIDEVEVPVADPVRPVRLTGSTYSPRNAALSLLVSRLAKLRAQYDVEIGDVKVKRSQQMASVEMQIAELRRGTGAGTAAGGIQTIPAYRTDLR